MKIQEISNLIKFSERDNSYGVTVLYGQIEIRSAVTISQRCPDFTDAKNQAKERIKSIILAKLYDDCRNEIAESVMRFRACNPMEFQRLDEATLAIMKAAKYTPPEE